MITMHTNYSPMYFNNNNNNPGDLLLNTIEGDVYKPDRGTMTTAGVSNLVGVGLAIRMTNSSSYEVSSTPTRGESTIGHGYLTGSAELQRIYSSSFRFSNIFERCRKMLSMQRWS